MIQAPSSIFMVFPDHFGYNKQTSGSNIFQNKADRMSGDMITRQALEEFESFVGKLRKFGIEVFAFHGNENDTSPDAVFPNNWISLHEDGYIVLYPMMAENRRKERQISMIQELNEHFEVKNILNYVEYEKKGMFLEGTGSIVFDHINRVAYANRSSRTNEKLLSIVCEELGYLPLIFDASDENGNEIYHTNVLMTIGDGFAVVCLESISSGDVNRVVEQMTQGNLAIIDISFKQLRNFAGNMIQLTNNKGEKILVMSSRAYQCLKPGQRESLLKYNNSLIHSDLEIIERVGGGSARCMIAGVYLNRKNGL